MELKQFYTAVDLNTREVKLFDNAIALRKFLRDNPDWMEKREAWN